jgi:hypothetical protein
MDFTGLAMTAHDVGVSFNEQYAMLAVFILGNIFLTIFLEQNAQMLLQS